MKLSADDTPSRGTQLVAMSDDPTDVRGTRTDVSVLVVEPVLPDAISLASALSQYPFQVTLAETFVKAKERIGSRAPDVLITDIRLGEYNGLHLVLRATAQRHEVAAIVLSSLMDEVLRADAESMRATFMLKPVSARDLAAAVFRTISRQKALMTATEPIRPPFERRSVDRRAVVFPIPVDRRLRDRRRDRDTLASFLHPVDPD